MALTMGLRGHLLPREDTRTDRVTFDGAAEGKRMQPQASSASLEHSLSAYNGASSSCPAGRHLLVVQRKTAEAAGVARASLATLPVEH